MTDKPIALITGANKGIGYQIAKQLGQDGHLVLAGAREEGRGRAAEAELRDAGADARFVQVDVTDEATVAAAAKVIDEEYGRLDVLVNNAGITGAGTWSAPSQTPMAGLRETYETNVFGVVAVTNAMLPLLRKSPAGRIVNMSSELGSLDFALDPSHPYEVPNMLAYNSSKSAVNGLTVAYAKELKDTPIKVNAACPGYCATDLNDHQGLRTAEQGAAIAVRLATLDDDGPTAGYFRDEGPIPW